MKMGIFTPAAMMIPFALWRQMNQIAWNSQMVIALRMAGMMGILKQDAAEPSRMVQEKADAAQEAMWAALQAAANGRRADHIMAAALRPYRRRTTANAKRLTVKGMRG